MAMHPEWIESPAAILDPHLLAMINPAIRGIEGDCGPLNANTCLRDLHKNLRADDVLAFRSELLRRGKRTHLGNGLTKGNADFPDMQNIIRPLSPHATDA